MILLLVCLLLSGGHVPHWPSSTGAHTQPSSGPESSMASASPLPSSVRQHGVSSTYCLHKFLATFRTTLVCTLYSSSVFASPGCGTSMMQDKTLAQTWQPRQVNMSWANMKKLASKLSTSPNDAKPAPKSKGFTHYLWAFSLLGPSFSYFLAYIRNNSWLL